MNKKMIITLFVLATLFLSINTVCANDVTDDSNTVTAADDSPLELSITDEKILTKQNGDTTFDGLNSTINSGKNIIDITTDYEFDEYIDEDFKRGITIKEDNIIINGNNHIIDAKGQSRIFNVTGNNITINNLILKNANDSAILDYGTLKTSNVEFTNCSSEVGAALYVFEGGYISENDKFINHHGGAIYSKNSNLTINKGIFDGNTADRGSAIQAENSYITLSNSLLMNNRNNWSSIVVNSCDIDVLNTTFTNSTSKYATAIYSAKSVVNIKKSRFINLYAHITAGALAFKQDNAVTIEDCEFIKSSSAKNGGAIFIDHGREGAGNLIMINNTLFDECLSEFGGAYLQLGGKSVISNSNFTSNYAEYNGGAIYLSTTISLIENCTFTENKVDTDNGDYPTYGGAVFCDNSKFELYDSKFSENLAVEGSALYLYDTIYTLNNLEFNGNANAVRAYFDEGSKRSNLKGSDKISDSDFGNAVYYDSVDGKGMQINRLDNDTNITSIPARYDLREEHLVTPVKDQGYMGACWTFGMLGSLESALLKVMNYTADFSENNMQNSMLTYSKIGSTIYTEGAYDTEAIAYLLSWFGAFPKDYDTYDELGKISPLITTDEDIHIQDVIIIPHNPGDNDSITNVKKAILKYGALDGCVLSKSTKEDGSPTNYYNTKTYAEYVPDHLNSNHEICVVGWDDNYSASNFLITPPGDGAWIVKNSWGSEWGDEGYFYISYYDQSLCAFPNEIHECFIAFVLENTQPYNYNYQYDFSGLNSFYSDNGTQLRYYNKYEAHEDALISAVGTYFDGEGEKYGITVEVNGEPVYTQSGVSPYYGYHTIELDSYIPIKKGDEFIVVINSTKMPICKNTRVHYENRTSVVIFSNGKYEDLSSENMVACIKAYTIEDNRHNTTLVTPNRVIGVNDAIYGYDYQFILKDENGTALANKEVLVTFKGNTQTVTTDEKGWATAKIKADTAGSYNIEVTFEGDIFYKKISKKATVTLIKQKTSFVAPDRTVYVRDMSNGYKYSAILKDNYGNALANKKVLFIFNGKKQVAMTDKNGWATVTLKADTAGTQKITIKFAGDRCYQETSTTKTIKIVRESSKLTVPYKAYKASTANKQVTATLKSTSGNPIYSAKVTLTVDGKTYAATTNSNGIATFTIDLSKWGIFTAISKFAESRFYAATTTTSKIAII